MILITGGLGYLGVRVTENLSDSGEKIRVASSRSKVFSQDGLNYNQQGSSSEIVTINMSDIDSLIAACSEVDYIIHLAALDAQVSSDDPVSALNINGLGTLNLLQAAIKEGVKKIIYISTVHVYRSPLEGFISEETLPQPSHHYAITHKLAEDYIMQANHLQQITGVILRLSNAVGCPNSPEGNAWKLVINDLCKQVVETKKMVFYSSPSVQRDYLPMHDVCEAIRYSLFEKEFDGKLFNLSSGLSLSLGELSQIIASRSKVKLGFTPEIIFKNQKTKAESLENLEISNKKITKGNFSLNASLESEIDKILINCSDWF